VKIIEVGELLWVPDDAVKVSEAFAGWSLSPPCYYGRTDRATR
jgi:hypothetical protein